MPLDLCFLVSLLSLYPRYNIRIPNFPPLPPPPRFWFIAVLLTETHSLGVPTPVALLAACDLQPLLRTAPLISQRRRGPVNSSEPLWRLQAPRCRVLTGESKRGSSISGVKVLFSDPATTLFEETVSDDGDVYGWAYVAPHVKLVIGRWSRGGCLLSCSVLDLCSWWDECRRWKTLFIYLQPSSCSFLFKLHFVFTIESKLELQGLLPCNDALQPHLINLLSSLWASCVKCITVSLKHSMTHIFLGSVVYN